MLNGGKAGVVVLLPAGRYKITQTLEITQANVVLRGEGVRCRRGLAGREGVPAHNRLEG